jgi:hypothetical protein
MSDCSEVSRSMGLSRTGSKRKRALAISDRPRSERSVGGTQPSREMAGFSPDEVSVAELHDASGTAEILHRKNAALALMERGCALVESGAGDTRWAAVGQVPLQGTSRRRDRSDPALRTSDTAPR